MYLLFDTQEKAEKALAKINENMGFPDKKGTKTWANIEKVKDKHEDVYFFIKPDNPRYLQGVLDYIEATHFDKKV